MPTIRSLPRLNDFSPDLVLEEIAIPLVRRRLSGPGDMGKDTDDDDLGVPGGSISAAEGRAAWTPIISELS